MKEKKETQTKMKTEETATEQSRQQTEQPKNPVGNRSAL
jgi:hypothetical protein